MSYLNLIKGSSRTRAIMCHPKNRNKVDVENHKTLRIKVSSTPGAKLNYLIKDAVTEINTLKISEPDTIPFVYFMAGIPDITERICKPSGYSRFSWVPKYKEVVFTQDPTQACTIYINKILDVSDRIAKDGGIPVFAR